MIEAHIQLSPDEEHCDHCVGVTEFPQIPPFTEFYFLLLPDGTQLNLCIEHLIATLQLNLSGEGNGG
jgi:hypothetical protein